MPREYTKAEVRQKFLELVWSYINYWYHLPDKTCLDRMEGLAFGMLVILDGGTPLSGFIVAPSPHAEDKQYLKDQGENWFPENHESTINCDIAGSLHELFHKFKKEL